MCYISLYTITLAFTVNNFEYCIKGLSLLSEFRCLKTKIKKIKVLNQKSLIQIKHSKMFSKNYETMKQILTQRANYTVYRVRL